MIGSTRGIKKKMYIRSQDKRELIEFHGLQIACSNGSYYIRPLNMDSYHSVGDYGSKRRCLEILDELQAALDREMKVFEMPKE